MNYLHSELQLDSGDMVEITLDHAANVMLLDTANFELYKQRKPYQYFGGHAEETPTYVAAPARGRWHLVVDLGGAPGTVRAGFRIVASQPV
ncbi:MAG: DUF1883 domain-containing protein [Gemmataceae bacterium]|nr:DUF1883 domain-containing protein [Gemmataceae bacterium]